MVFQGLIKGSIARNNCRKQGLLGERRILTAYLYHTSSEEDFGVGDGERRVGLLVVVSREGNGKGVMTSIDV